MGSEAVVQAAEQYGKNFICSEKIEAVDLQDLCYKVAINFILSYSFRVFLWKLIICVRKVKIWIWYHFQLSVRLEADSHGRAIVSPPATLATSTEAVDLLKQMLQLFQNERITAEQALKHPLFSNWILYQH